MVERTGIGGHTAVRSARCPRHADRAATGAAPTDSREWIARRRSWRANVAPTIGRQLLNPEPDRIVDDAPLGYFPRDHLTWSAGDDDALPAAPYAMNQPVPVDAAVALATQDLADAPRRPRIRAAPPGSRRAHTFGVEPAGDLLEPEPFEVPAEDPANDVRFALVDNSDRVRAPRSIGLALERIPEATATGDAPCPHARSQRFLRARTDRLKLHLVADATDERRRGINRVRERNLLSGRVVHQARAAISNQLPDRERHFQRVPTQARLIPAEHDVAGLHVVAQSPKLGPPEEIIASAIVIDVLDARLPGDDDLPTRQLLDHKAPASLALNVERELLVALVRLRTPKVDAQRGSTRADDSEVRIQIPSSTPSSRTICRAIVRARTPTAAAIRSGGSAGGSSRTGVMPSSNASSTR